ncbi:unnamed protein product [Cyclocybe aegerita]|uniref:DUF6699 domain-containing protein n=1 Tax=Cyclocybe aegerita TaxID=1973307 RepID=A0A8S0WXL0_CYCAE|nr:unnamed protein product [Cyclocybe aegerita]
MFNWSSRSKGYDQPPSSGGFFRRVISFNRGSSIPRPQTPQTWNSEPPYGPGPPQGSGPSALYNQYYAQPQYSSQNARPQHNSWQTSYDTPPPRRDEPRGPIHPPNYSGPQPHALPPPPQTVPLREYAPKRLPNPDYRPSAAKPPSPQVPRYDPYTYNQSSHSARNNGYSSHSTVPSYRSDPHSQSRPINNDYYSSSSRHSSRADPPPRPRRNNAGHTPYFDPPDFLQNRRDSVGSQHDSTYHSSNQRPRTNPYANTPRGTPWQSSASLARTDESGRAPSTRSRPDSVAPPANPASQSRTSVGRTGALAVVNPDPPSPKYQLAPELRITSSGQYPWINYAIWLKPSTAELMVAQGKAVDVKHRELAFSPPVNYIRIKSYKHDDPLSLVIARWGPIEVGRPNGTKALTVYNILFEIWDYFQKSIESHEWPEFEAKEAKALMFAIEASFDHRQTVPDTGIPWAENARAGATRVDTLWKYWMFGGLKLDKDFEKNRVVRMKLSSFGTYDDR